MGFFIYLNISKYYFYNKKMIQPEKRLVFHFYINDGWEDSITNKIHLECLRIYSYVFDEVMFVISLDDTSNIELIRSLELFLLDLGLTPRISFKIVENSYLRDSKTFYDFVVKDMDKYDGLTFFAHNKGTTNLSTYDIENVATWIISMYFLSLEYIKEVENSLTEGRRLSFGSLLNEIEYDKIVKGGTDSYWNGWEEWKEAFVNKGNAFLGEFKYQYMGTFFWINGKTIFEYARKNKIEIPTLTDRWYAENFCSNLYPMQFAASHKGLFSQNYLQAGAEINEMVKESITEDEMDNFLTFKNEILSRVL